MAFAFTACEQFAFNAYTKLLELAGGSTIRNVPPVSCSVVGVPKRLTKFEDTLLVVVPALLPSTEIVPPDCLKIAPAANILNCPFKIIDPPLKFKVAFTEIASLESLKPVPLKIVKLLLATFKVPAVIFNSLIAAFVVKVTTALLAT